MVYLCVSFTNKSREEVEGGIKKLEHILTAWDLKIIEQVVNQENLSIYLTINASMPAIMGHVVSIAQAQFKENLIESRMVYEY